MVLARSCPTSRAMRLSSSTETPSRAWGSSSSWGIFASATNSTLKVLPECLLGNLKYLEYLYADHIEIENLPDHFFDNNHKIVMINMATDTLKPIEVDFTEMKKLRQIYFSSNRCIK